MKLTHRSTELNSGRRLCSANIPTFVVPCTMTKLDNRSRTKTMEQSAKASVSIRDTHNFQDTIKDIFVFRLGCST